MRVQCRAVCGVDIWADEAFQLKYKVGSDKLECARSQVLKLFRKIVS